MGSFQRTVRIGIALLGIGSLAPTASLSGGKLDSLAAEAVSPDAGRSERAIAALRGAGPAGLQALLEMREPSERICWTGPGGAPRGAEEGRWCGAVEAVARQRDASVSGLFWYTDLEEAMAAARPSGRPILSLRLLGRLDEDFSCANSRFFRVALYSDPEIAHLMRERFVLHWKSERPVPRVTIDFGDGRTLQQPITGNSVHYLLDGAGRPIDALPGLYGPRAFRRWLEGAQRASRAASRSALASYHLERLASTRRAVAADRRRGGFVAPLVEPEIAPSAPNALQAAPVAMTKSVRVELPIVRAVLAGNPDSTERTREAWSAMAKLLEADARLSPRAKALLSREGRSRPIPPGALQEFESLMALDTVRNEYLLHAQIHRWFGNARSLELERLNERIYAELFLTPRSDPWLGLAPSGYTALTSVIVR